MKNILVSGSYSVGKSTVTRELEQRIPSDQRIVTHDIARYYLERNRQTSDQQTPKEKRELQMNVVAGYIGAFIQASHSGVMAVVDGSLIEAMAYSKGILPQNTLNLLDKYLAQYKEHSVAYIIPPTIPLVADNLRHTDKEFRIEINQRIMQIIDHYQIPYEILTSQTPDGRAEEIINHHFCRQETPMNEWDDAKKREQK